MHAAGKGSREKGKEGGCGDGEGKRTRRAVIICRQVRKNSSGASTNFLTKHELSETGE